MPRGRKSKKTQEQPADTEIPSVIITPVTPEIPPVTSHKKETQIIKKSKWVY